VLVGRSEAFERIAWVVSGARAGRGGALLLRGDAGSGKTALLAATDTSGATLLRCAGAPDERDLPFATLHALVRPLRHLAPALVPAQREALDLALGVTSGSAPAPLLIGAALLSLLDAATNDAPVLLLVDDAHWIDSESRNAIGFAARRLEDDAVGIILTARPETVALSGIEVYDLPSLDDEESIALLADRGVARAVAQRLAPLAGGNPLALVELAGLLTPGQRAGAALLPDPLPSTTPTLAYRQLLDSLPPQGRVAVAAAAADTLSPAVLAEVLAGLGTSHDALVPAEATGLLRVATSGVTWRHPLARAAALECVDAAQLRHIHAAVADALERADGEPAAIVWHRVGAATGPDEALADALEAVARTAASRGAHQASSYAWETAARLGADPATRLAAAALEAWAADDAETASRLIEEAMPTVRDADLRWRLAFTAGQIAHAVASPLDAWNWLMRAVEEARAVENRDHEVRALAGAFNPALHLDDGGRLSRLAEEIAAAASPDDPAQDARSHAVQGFVLLNADRTDAGRAHLELALASIDEHDLLAADPELLPMTVQAAMWSGHPRRLRPAIDAAVSRLRAAGETRIRGHTVRGLAWCDFSVAEWDSAAVLADDALDLARISGRVADIADALVQVATLEGPRGHTAEALAHAEEARSLAGALDSPWRTVDALWCSLLASMSVGDLAGLVAPTDALAAVLRDGRVAAAQPEYYDAPLALALTGRRADAQDLLDLLLTRSGDDPRPESRAGAFLARSAIGPDSRELADVGAGLADELLGVEYVFPRARLRLSAGSMLRRLGHRVEARALLRDAEGEFAGLGAVPWLSRTQEELRASGATLRSGAARDDALTASETRVATAAAAGMSNKEIAATLFLSSKTVEFHLGRIYRKLGLRNRADLVRLLLTPPADGVAPDGD
jgi:DNA-binding CsgD family transcriptional regulator